MKLGEIYANTRVFLRGRKVDYQLTFGSDDKTRGPAAQRVLDDLAKFCRANETTYHPDPVVAAALVGRREVFLRIAEHLNLTPDQLMVRYGGQLNGNDNAA